MSKNSVSAKARFQELDRLAESTFISGSKQYTPFDVMGVAHGNARDTFQEQGRGDQEGSEEFFAMALATLECTLACSPDVSEETLAWFKGQGVTW